MEALFLQILEMSISASWLILAVLLIRFLLKKAPKGFRYVLWALVAIRLLCPVFVESEFSLIPSQNVISEVGQAEKPSLPVQPSVPEGNGGVQNDNVQNNDVSNQTPGDSGGQNDALQDNNTQNNIVQNTPAINDSTAENQSPITVIAWIWIGGILALLTYGVVTYGQLRKTIKASIQREDNLWICDGIQSPFIFGLIRPQIYLPSYIEEGYVPYIVAHEKEHIRCKDNWWKPLGFVLLTIHWFNPLVWVAYVFLCRDIELACDERVVRSMNVEDKKNYSKSLLLCSNPRHFISACPVAFGEVGVKERIKKIVDYRKPSVWIIGIGIVICLIMVVGFMTNPKDRITDVAKISLRGSAYLDVTVEITDKETIAYILNSINDLSFVPIAPNLPSGGWGYEMKTYDADGNIMDDLIILGDDIYEGEWFLYKTVAGRFDTDYYDKLIEEEYQRQESIDPIPEMEELSKARLEWFATDFFNNDENRITNMFLTSEYRKPEDISLENLFYHGANGYGDAPVSDEEKQLLAQKDSNVYDLDVTKTTRQEMENILQKYMAISFWETNQIGLNTLHYLPEYDAYYKVAGDAKISKYTFEKGWLGDDGTIILEYYDALSSSSERFRVTLKEEQEKYYFISNVSMSEDKNEESSKEWPKNLLTQENLKWFETEFFNLEGNRITNQFLSSEYQTPEDISLLELFHDGNGIVDGENQASAAEKQLLLERYIEEIELDVARTSRNDMNDILKKYMGISLEETNKVHLSSMYYLAEYDAYYYIHGDTNYNHYTMEKGFFNGDGTITLLYKKVSSYRDEPRYIVTLKPVGDSYQFLSNMKLK